MRFTTEQLYDIFAALAYGIGKTDLPAFPSGVKTKAGDRAGLKDGINDLLHMSDCFDYRTWRAIDERLAAKGLPSLETLQVLLTRKHLKILKRGRIRNEEEYYLVQNLLGDLTSDLTDAQRIALERMTLEFGQRRQA